MLALITALIAGMAIFLRAGLLLATVSVLCGYAAFVAYAYFRSRMWMNDPANAAALAEGRQPGRAIRIERAFAAVLLPALFAYIPYLLLSHPAR